MAGSALRRAAAASGMIGMRIGYQSGVLVLTRPLAGHVVSSGGPS